jgi:integrase
MPAEYETRKRITPPKVDISKALLTTFGPDERRAWWGQMERKGASRSQIHNADAVLTGMLRAHKRLGIHPEVLDADVITRPTVDRTPRRRPSAAEMLRLISFCSVDWTEDGEPREPYATLFTLKALTGCRIGELRGLHWGDIDEIRGGINVRVQMDRFTKQPRDTKGHAQRYIALDGPDSDAMQLLAAHKKRQQERGLATGAGDLVFLYRRYLSQTPKAISPFAIGLAFTKARDAAKLPTDLTPHCLRHGSAMISLRSGTDLVTLQRRLGHKHITTTAQYLEADGTLAQADASRLANAMKRTPKAIKATG